ncbi:hypothetical protein K2173_010429 [Erythroxylum novogranatense]|uniref:Uncharacterized protein n=1 Tax=Erythroxylum novogranatense TaxID=1862640 RepID=A0AAV8TFC7_9ROSI|nr:hypothetical protein K2173_010429 [Erythroxylum novogranatense]
MISKRKNSPSSTANYESPTTYKLRKIPPNQIHQTQRYAADDNRSEPDDSGRMVEAEEESGKRKGGENSPIIIASSLRLNHIQTRSAPSPSPLGLVTSCKFENDDGFREEYLNPNPNP